MLPIVKVKFRLFATPWTIYSRPEVHGILQARILEWVAFPFSRGSSQPRNQSQVWLNPGLQHRRQILSQLSHRGSPRILDWVAYPFSRGSSRPRNGIGVSCLAGGFFTSRAIRKAPSLYIAWPTWALAISSFSPWNPLFPWVPQTPHWSFSLLPYLLLSLRCWYFSRFHPRALLSTVSKTIKIKCGFWFLNVPGLLDSIVLDWSPDIFRLVKKFLANSSIHWEWKNHYCLALSISTSSL